MLNAKLVTMTQGLGWLVLVLAQLACNAKTTTDGPADGSGGSATNASVGAGTTSATSPGPFVEQLRLDATDKVDLLLVVDNSVSMLDKQQILANAVPRLIQRLVNPDCVMEDDQGKVTARQPFSDGCPDGFAPEFNPLDDIHIGVISSSLGGHGGEICTPDSPGEYNETQNDRAHLMPTVRPDANLAAEPEGFLEWNPAATTPEQLQTDLAEHVLASGERGCGYEAPLEAWYRFLIDPSPPLEMVNDGSRAYPATGDDGQPIIDTGLLAQRAAFLRPDSIVAIVMLSDENDCSIVDGGIGWIAAQATTNGSAFTMPPATSACETNPNDACCRSCGLNEASPPSGCESLAADPNCSGSRPAGTDSLNLRCYNQKQRFGFDLLYPVERYVSGLRDLEVVDTHACTSSGECMQVANPLYEVGDAVTPRDRTQVFLMGIVGVPWQDLATSDSLDSAEELVYLSASELAEAGRWSMVLGNPDADNPRAPENWPLDPLMLETPDPRSGTHPVTGESVAPETSTDPTENAINGHEMVNTDSTDLQYACIFPLSEPRDCSEASTACDCTETELAKNRPLCNPPGGGEATTTQHYAKAYPSSRQLEVLRDLGEQSVVASICPKLTAGDTSDPYAGYNPAINALVDTLKPALEGRCLPRALAVDDAGSVRCGIIEATLTPYDCSDPGRATPDDELVRAIHEKLEANRSCGGDTLLSCDSYHLCEVKQLTGQDQVLCQNERDYVGAGGQLPGFCYLDGPEAIGSSALLQGCPITQPYKLQFVGDNTPRLGAISFIYCDDEL